MVLDFNGIHVTQAKDDYMKLSCANYINWIMISHRWETSSNKDNENTATPLHQADVLNKLPNHIDGIIEGTAEHRDIQNKQGFPYRSLLGET